MNTPKRRSPVRMPHTPLNASPNRSVFVTVDQKLNIVIMGIEMERLHRLLLEKTTKIDQHKQQIQQLNMIIAQQQANLAQLNNQLSYNRPYRNITPPHRVQPQLYYSPQPNQELQQLQMLIKNLEMENRALKQRYSTDTTELRNRMYSLEQTYSKLITEKQEEIQYLQQQIQKPSESMSEMFPSINDQNDLVHENQSLKNDNKLLNDKLDLLLFDNERLKQQLNLGVQRPSCQLIASKITNFQSSNIFIDYQVIEHKQGRSGSVYSHSHYSGSPQYYSPQPRRSPLQNAIEFDQLLSNLYALQARLKQTNSIQVVEQQIKVIGTLLHIKRLELPMLSQTTRITQQTGYIQYQTPPSVIIRTRSSSAGSRKPQMNTNPAPKVEQQLLFPTSSKSIRSRSQTVINHEACELRYAEYQTTINQLQQQIVAYQQQQTLLEEQWRVHYHQKCSEAILQLTNLEKQIQSQKLLYSQQLHEQQQIYIQQLKEKDAQILQYQNAQNGGDQLYIECQELRSQITQQQLQLQILQNDNSQLAKAIQQYEKMLEQERKKVSDLQLNDQCAFLTIQVTQIQQQMKLSMAECQKLTVQIQQLQSQNTELMMQINNYEQSNNTNQAASQQYIVLNQQLVQLQQSSTTIYNQNQLLQVQMQERDQQIQLLQSQSQQYQLKYEQLQQQYLLYQQQQQQQQAVKPEEPQIQNDQYILLQQQVKQYQQYQIEQQQESIKIETRINQLTNQIQILTQTNQQYLQQISSFSNDSNQQSEQLNALRLQLSQSKSLISELQLQQQQKQTTINQQLSELKKLKDQLATEGKRYQHLNKQLEGLLEQQQQLESPCPQQDEQQQQLEIQYKSLQEQYQQSQVKVQQYKQQYIELEKSISQLQESLNTQRLQLSQSQKQNSDLSLQLQQKSKQVTDLTFEQKKLRESNQQLNQTIEQLKITLQQQSSSQLESTKKQQDDQVEVYEEGCQLEPEDSQNNYDDLIIGYQMQIATNAEYLLLIKKLQKEIKEQNASRQQEIKYQNQLLQKEKDNYQLMNSKYERTVTTITELTYQLESQQRQFKQQNTTNNYEQEVEQLKITLKNKESELNNYKLRQQQLTLQLESQQRQYQQQNQTSNLDYEHEIEQLKATLKRREFEIKDLNLKLQQSQNNYSRIMQQQQNYQQDQSITSSTTTHLTTIQINQDNQYQSGIENSEDKDRIQELISEVQIQTMNLSQKQLELNAVQLQLQKLTSVLTKTEQQLADAKESERLSILDLQMKIKQLTASLQQTTSQYEQSTQQITIITEKYSTIQFDKNKLIDMNKQQEQVIYDLTQQIRTLQNIQGNKSQDDVITQLEDQIHQLRLEYKRQVEQLTTENSRIPGLILEIDNLHQQVQQLELQEKELHSVQREHLQKLQEAAIMRTEFEQLRTIYSEIQLELQHEQQISLQLKQTVSNLREQIAQLQEQLRDQFNNIQLQQKSNQDERTRLQMYIQELQQQLQDQQHNESNLLESSQQVNGDIQLKADYHELQECHEQAQRDAELIRLEHYESTKHFEHESAILKQRIISLEDRLRDEQYDMQQTRDLYDSKIRLLQDQIDQFHSISVDRTYESSTITSIKDNSKEQFESQLNRQQQYQEQLQQEIDRLKFEKGQTIQKFNDQISQYGEQLDQLLLIQKKLEEENISLRSQLGDLQQDYENFKRRNQILISGLEDRLRDAQYASQQQNSQMLEKMLQEQFESERAELKTQIANLEMKYNDLLYNNNNQMIQDYEVQIRRLNDQISLLYQQMQQKMTEHKQKINDLVNEFEFQKLQYKERIKELEQRLEMNGQIEHQSLLNENQMMAQQIADLQAQLNQLRQQQDNQPNRNQNVIKTPRSPKYLEQIKKLEKLVEQYEEQIAELQQEIHMWKLKYQSVNNEKPRRSLHLSGSEQGEEDNRNYERVSLYYGNVQQYRPQLNTPQTSRSRVDETKQKRFEDGMFKEVLYWKRKYDEAIKDRGTTLVLEKSTTQMIESISLWKEKYQDQLKETQQIKQQLMNLNTNDRDKQDYLMSCPPPEDSNQQDPLTMEINNLKQEKQELLESQNTKYYKQEQQWREEINTLNYEKTVITQQWKQKYDSAVNQLRQEIEKIKQEALYLQKTKAINLQDEQQGYELQIVQKNKEISYWREKYDEVIKDLEILEQQIHQSNGQVKQYQSIEIQQTIQFTQQIEMLKKELVQKQQDVSYYKSKCEDINYQYQQIESQLKSLQNQTNNYNTQFDQQNRLRIEELQNSLTIQKEEYLKSVNQINKLSQDKSKEVDYWKGKYDTLMTQNDQLNKQINDLSTKGQSSLQDRRQIEQLHLHLENIQQERSQDLAYLKSKLEEQLAINQKQDEEIQYLQQKYDKLNTQYQQLNAQGSKQQDKQQLIDQLLKERTRSQELLKQLKSELLLIQQYLVNNSDSDNNAQSLSYQAQIKGLQQANQQYQSQINELKNQIDNSQYLKQENAQLRQQIQCLQESNTRLDNMIKSRAPMPDLSEFDRLNVQLREAINELNHRKMQYFEALNTISNLENALITKLENEFSK